MKKLFHSLIGFGLGLLSLAACTEGSDYDIDYTPIAPVGGQYVVTVYSSHQDSAYTEVTQTYAFLSNTSDYDTDKAWIRVGGYNAKNAYNINAKVNIDMATYTFEGTMVPDYIGNSAVPTDSVTLTGYATHNEYTTPSGTITDFISFEWSRSDQPDYKYKAEGWKYTGWDGDDL